MTPSVQTKVIPVTEIEKAETSSASTGMRCLYWFRQALAPETALHQSIVSLADQGVASATNFLTGIIIARACSKEELGLYMLGFSLVLLAGGLQTTLICTPYMVFAPRLKGSAH